MLAEADEDEAPGRGGVAITLISFALPFGRGDVGAVVAPPPAEEEEEELSGAHEDERVFLALMRADDDNDDEEAAIVAAGCCCATDTGGKGSVESTAAADDKVDCGTATCGELEGFEEDDDEDDEAAFDSGAATCDARLGAPHAHNSSAYKGTFCPAL